MRWLTRSQLKSKDPEIRQEAVAKLSERSGVKDIVVFAKTLHDENAGVRKAATAAITILRETNGEECIAVLLPWLRDKNFSLRASAASALELLGWRPSTSEERVLNAVASGNFNFITPREEAAADILLPLLKADSQSVRFAAAQTFEQLQLQDPRIVQPLIDLLKDPDLPVRVSALQALSDLIDERRIPPLLAMLKDQAPQIRAIAAEAIGKTGDPKFLSNISPLLKDSKFEVRLAAIKALGRINRVEALDSIISVLTDSDADVRKSAVDSLARLRDPRTVEALVLMLIDPESVVRHAAANALQTVGGDWRKSKDAQKTIPRLEAALNDDEYWVREAAKKALSEIRA